jgi:hypothetical protein
LLLTVKLSEKVYGLMIPWQINCETLKLFL